MSESIYNLRSDQEVVITENAKKFIRAVWLKEQLIIEPKPEPLRYIWHNGTQTLIAAWECLILKLSDTDADDLAEGMFDPEDLQRWMAEGEDI